MCQSLDPQVQPPCDGRSLTTGVSQLHLCSPNGFVLPDLICNAHAYRRAFLRLAAAIEVVSRKPRPVHGFVLLTTTQGDVSASPLIHGALRARRVWRAARATESSLPR